LPGQVFALTGANGAGKSTFFKSFLEKGNLPEGLKHKPGLKIGYLPQENNFDDVANLTLEDFLEKMSNFVREMNDWDFDDDLFAKGESILFTEALQTKVGDLSGGEKTKLQMFILLLRKAELIFLDEPTNHIDQEGQALLTVLIKKLTQGGTSFVISSHNEDFLEKNSQNGVLKISQEGGKRKIKKEKIYKREGETKNKIKIPWFRDAILTGQVYSGGSATVLGQEMSLNPIKSGDKVILAGDNGSGKTTLLKFLADLNNGKVERSSRPVYMPQEWPKEIQNGTLKDFLQYLEVDEKVFRKVLAESGFLESRSKDFTLLSKFSNLSLGEQRLLWFLAISSRNDTSFLLLDEPTNHLDASLKTEILKAILVFG
jgi:ATPase subunit of ABC transporter with duplicated ATPase domains